VQSHCGTLASNTREESIGDEISKFLLAARTFCTESYYKDIGSENRHIYISQFLCTTVVRLYLSCRYLVLPGTVVYKVLVVVELYENV
jgi:hypothetical protein